MLINWACHLCMYVARNLLIPSIWSIGKRGHGRRTTDAGQRTPDTGQAMEKTDKDGKDGQTMEKTDDNDGKDGQTMEKTDKRWTRRTNDGKDGQTMEKTDKRWKRRTNDGKDGQTMEKTNNDGKDGQTMKKTRFLIDRPFMNISAQMSVFVIFTKHKSPKYKPISPK